MQEYWGEQETAVRAFRRGVWSGLRLAGGMLALFFIAREVQSWF